MILVNLISTNQINLNKITKPPRYEIRVQVLDRPNDMLVTRERAGGGKPPEGDENNSPDDSNTETNEHIDFKVESQSKIEVVMKALMDQMAAMQKQQQEKDDRLAKQMQEKDDR